MDSLSKPVVELTNISKIYGFIQALKNINLTIYPGETVGLVGNNGAGKSTLLKIISLLVKPTSGSINLFDKEVNDDIHLFKREIGVLLSFPFFYEDMTGRENLNFFLQMKKRAINPQKVIQDIITQYDLKLFIDRPFYELSTGMMKKLDILRTVTPNFPKLLLLDEPFSGLDIENRRFLFNLIQKREVGSTVIMCSHDLPSVKSVCSKIIFLEKGKIKKVLDPLEYDYLLDRIAQ